MIKKSSLRRIGTLTGILSAAFLLSITQASAVSREAERATDRVGPGNELDNVCNRKGANGASIVCYFGQGDWIKIEDEGSDGYSAVMDWEIRDRENRTVRYGSTFNADGYATARYKNKNFPDSSHSIRFRACLGHWSTRLIAAGTCSSWISTDT
ncbi:hypothetical protein AB0H94_44470 [Streptomyces purpurascens]|uniref:hypothetical protein n=1 Tax=Streptomyces purpurascens TaxID=1924 RepID=UPI0033F90322